MDIKELYNEYWRDYFNFDATFEGHRYCDKCINSGLEFNTVLEIGTGNGGGIQKFLDAGKQATGIEYSHYLYENLLKDKYPCIVEASVANIPFPDNYFDMVCSFDVLEHIPELWVDKAIGEIYRVSKRYFYGTISNRIDHYKKFHLTIKPHEWWEEKFLGVGFRKLNLETGIHGYEK